MDDLGYYCLWTAEHHFQREGYEVFPNLLMLSTWLATQTRQLKLEDCERISHRLSEVLDEKDPIEGSYRLEVSSPGIDRPLTRRSDYSDWAGHEARLKLDEALGGAKQLSGTIKGIDQDMVLLATPKGDREIPFESIASAKLLLTDELIKATAPLDAEGADLIKMEG